MALLGYTSYDEIRAALGVNDEELTDEKLGLRIYEDNLATELDEVDAILVEKYEASVALGEGASKAQKRLVASTRLLATYIVARQLSGSLSMFSVKSMSDSKAEVSRFSDPYKETIKHVKAQWEVYRQRTLAALAATQSTDVVVRPRTIMLISTATTDPVTTS